MSRAPRIAIIGGGIGGLAAAVALRQRGMDVAVYERSSELKEVGAGLRLTPNALKALRVLGLENAALQAGVRIDRSISLDWKTARVISTQDTSAARYGAPVLCIHRADMLEVFQSALAAMPGGFSSIELGAACTSVESSDRFALARFADGREIEADAVIGADGIHSAVRASLFGKDQPEFTGCVCWRGMMPIERFPHDPHDTHRWLGPHGHVVSYPVRRGELLNFVAHYDSDAWTGESWTHEAAPGDLERTYAGWHRDVLAMFEVSEVTYQWALYDRAPLETWGHGRVTLLGDAAHAMLPYLSQGASMTLEDACVLANCMANATGSNGLATTNGPASANGISSVGDPAGAYSHAHAQDGLGLTAALREYERLRMPRTRRAQLGSRFRAKENHLASPAARAWRDFKAGLRNRFARDKSPDGVSWIYDYDAAAPDTMAR